MSGEDLYSGTESMRSGLELDADKVEAFFRENLQDFGGNAEITQFKGGQSNPTYKVSSGRKSWVIRRKPPGQLLPSAHAVDREFRDFFSPSTVTVSTFPTVLPLLSISTNTPYTHTANNVLWF